MGAGWLDDLFTAYREAHAPGAAVAVVRAGEPVLTAAYGLARLDPPEPVTPATAFRLASITKQFTARAVALLAERGEITMDAPVADAVPGLPAWGREVRVGHLVAHTSGLPDYEPLIPPGHTTSVTDRDVLAILAGVDGLDFEPGSRFAYNNGGYALLGVLVEEVSGRDFSTFLRDEVFGPAGLESTAAHVEGVTRVAHRAYGYARSHASHGGDEGTSDRRDDGGSDPGGDGGVAGWEDADRGEATAVLGDGGVYSSVVDLARWEEVLRREDGRGDPGGAAALAAFAAPVAAGVRYGFGWYLDAFRGHRRLRHDGWSTGFQNEVQRFPDAGLAVVVLTNRASPSVRALAEAIAKRLLPAR